MAAEHLKEDPLLIHRTKINYQWKDSFFVSFQSIQKANLIHSLLFFDSFTVESTDGTIKASKVLDYEKNTEFEFFMLANDGGRFFEENKKYVIKIHVFLQDMNDNDPIFQNTPYEADIKENQTDIVFVYQVCKLFFIPVAISDICRDFTV